MDRGTSSSSACSRVKLSVLQETHGDKLQELFSFERRETDDLPEMNTIVFNKLSSQVLFEEKAAEVEMSSRNYLEVIDGQHPDLLSSSQSIRDTQAIRHRRNGYVADGQHVC